MSNVSPNDAQDDIFGAFKTYWTNLYPNVPVAWPDKPFDPAADVPEDADAAWVRVFSIGFPDFGHTPHSGSVATNFFQNQGRVTFEVYVREGDGGTVRANTLAYAIQGFLDGANTTHVYFRNRTGIQPVGGDGTWFQVIQAADWVYFTDRAAP